MAAEIDGFFKNDLRSKIVESKLLVVGKNHSPQAVLCAANNYIHHLYTFYHIKTFK